MADLHSVNWFRTLLFAVTLSCTPAVHAGEQAGHLDVAVIDVDNDGSNSSLGSYSQAGTGLAARLLMPIGETVFLHLDYHDANYDGTDIDADILRIGPGMRLPSFHDTLSVMARVDYIRSQASAPDGSSASTESFGFVGMLHYQMAGSYSAWLHAGYFDNDLGDGTLFELGMDLKLSDAVSVFLSYASVDEIAAGEPYGFQGDMDASLDELRAGIRLWFISYD